MSGIHYYMKDIHWDFKGDKTLESLNLCGGIRYSIMFDLENKGFAYAPCVYTDDPGYDPPSENGCCKEKKCSFCFLSTIEKFLK